MMDSMIEELSEEIDKFIDDVRSRLSELHPEDRVEVARFTEWDAEQRLFYFAGNIDDLVVARLWFKKDDLWLFTEYGLSYDKIHKHRESAVEHFVRSMTKTRAAMLQ